MQRSNSAPLSLPFVYGRVPCGHPMGRHAMLQCVTLCLSTAMDGVIRHSATRAGSGGAAAAGASCKTAMWHHHCCCLHAARCNAGLHQARCHAMLPERCVTLQRTQDCVAGVAKRGRAWVRNVRRL